MKYTAADVVTIVAAFGVLLTALGAVIVNIIVALKQTSAIHENTAVTSAVSAKADVITGHVNGAATAAAAKIDALERRVTGLLDVIADKKETAALLAQAAAQRTTPPIGHQRASDVPIKVEVMNEPLLTTITPDPGTP